MTSRARPPSPVARNRPPFRHRLHRLLGTATGALLLYLIATGVPLQLTRTLNLAGSYVSSPTILDWYGIAPPAAGYASDAAVHLGGTLFWNETVLADSATFQGAVRLENLSVLALGRRLVVFPETAPGSAEAIDLPVDIRRIGRTADRVMLETEAGVVAMDADLLNVDTTTRVEAPIRWAELTPLEGARLEHYQALARGRVLTRERLLQDLHSGRAFGPLGEWLVTLGSLAMVALALSGFLIWWRTR